MKRIFTLARRNLKEILREPTSLIFLILLPLVMEILFYFLFHSLTSQFEMKYLAPGMIGFAHAFLSLFVALLVAADRESAFIQRIYTTPVRPYEFILGYLAAITPFGLIQSLILMGGGCIFEPTLLSLSLLWLIPAALLSIIMFAAIGILFGSVFSLRAVGGISSILISGQSILSGMWFPVEGLSDGFLTVMELLPFKSICMIFQNTVTPTLIENAFSDLWQPVIVIGVSTVVCSVLSCVFFVKNSRSA